MPRTVVGRVEIAGAARAVHSPAAMRIARKFTLALVACVALALTLNAILTVRDEAGRFEAEVAAHHAIVGRALRPVLVSVWTVDGRDRALALLRDADQRLRRVEIRWVWLDPTGEVSDRSGSEPALFVPRIDAAKLEPLRRGEDVTVVDRKDHKIVSYVPLKPPNGDPPGAIEITAPLEREEEVLRAAVRQAIFLVLGVTLLAALATFLLGLVFVGRPMTVFIDQARRIGLGNLSYRIPILQRDEFGALADEMNRMCDSLVESRAAIESATDGKIRAIEQLRHADRLATVGRLAAGMAHELGTPLNVVSARAKPIMQGRTEADQAKDSARIIVEQVDRMAKIMRQLLDFARKRGLARTASDLRQTVQRVATFVEPIASKRDVSVDFDPPADEVVARVDPAQMEQVVTNLVMNAIQASPRSAHVTMTIGREMSASPNDGQPSPVRCAVIRVTDRGTGIAPTNLAQVFEPFFTTKEIGEGTGLGLSVAYGIVKDHGGWITVESTLGEGSTFSVCIPEESS